jgi:hypothetical protein
MIERRRRASLPFETSVRRRVGGHRARQKLYGDQAIESHVARLVHLTHSPSLQELHNAIRADLRPGWNLFDGRGLDWLVGTAAEKVRGGFVTLEKRLDLEA